MVEKRTWDEFRNSRMLWWANRVLHVFGWSIIAVMNGHGKIVDVYPARVAFRGFGDKQEEDGFIGISQYMADNASQLLEEAKS
jgi:hypothetical protein